MVDINTQENQISVNVSSAGNKTVVSALSTDGKNTVNAFPDMSNFYAERSREWAISDKIVNNEDYSSKYYAQKSKEQVTEATNQANIAITQADIATEQANIATDKTTEVVESANTALSNIATAKNNALNEISTIAENVEQYAQNALNSANNASESENNALSYKNSAQESSQTATEQASIAVSKSNEAVTSATNAKISETNAKSSETRCEEILSRLGTAIKIKGRVDSFDDLPLGDNLDGDAYLVGGEGLDSYPEYYWYQDHWEFLGTTGTSLKWGLISGDITAQSDLINKLNTKQNVISDLATIRSGATLGATALQNTDDCMHKTGYETIAGVKTFSSTISGSINGNAVTANRPSGFGSTRTNFWASVNATAKSGTIVNGANTPNGGSYILSNRISGNGAALDMVIDGNFYQNEGAYQVIDTSTGVTHTQNTAVGSATKPVYINSNGVATAITSYEGNSATATKATRDGDGNVITSTYLKKTEAYHPPLLSTMWSDHLINDMSWLKADTFSWHSGTTYSLAYNELLSEYNNSASVTQTEEKKWIQPVLTANGTLGGSSFAVSADSADSNRAAYKSFDGNYATKWGKGNTTTGNLIFYNPTKIKITKITQTPVTDYPAEDYGTYTLYGSNDNSTWTQLCQITVEASKSAEYIPTNPDFYNYYKISQSGGHNYAGTGELSITATELVGTITYKRTPKGYKIALATQETAIAEKYATDGIAWYYILDTTNKKFKLPRTKFGFEGIRDSVGNDITESLPNITGEIKCSQNNLGNGWNGALGAISGSGYVHNGTVSGGTIALQLDASRSSSTYQDGAPVQERATQMYLYFYVGEFTKSAEAQTAGLNSELLNSKVDTSSLVECQVVTETYTSGTSGYRIWSDGYCEQWGVYKSSGTTDVTVSFIKTFANTDYILLITNKRTSASTTATAIKELGYYNKKTTDFSKYCSSNSSYDAGFNWKACGYLAEGEY